MKLLIVSQGYPSLNDRGDMAYVHVRNKYYLENKIEVTVLSFRAKESYSIEGINVITLEEYEKQNQEKYDILVCHAPNIRNHYKFLRKYEKNFSKIVFFFHGHEVLRLNKVYPEPYEYQKEKSIIEKMGQDLYDTVKLKLWSKYYTKLAYKAHFVFVSKWIYDEFLKWTGIDSEKIKGNYSIIHNSVGKVFEEKNYDSNSNKKYDFISIRGGLDGSKYGVDIINDLANNNPDLKFLLIGRGEFFNHFNKSSNITWINTVLGHEEMIELMNESRCGLLPTRQDTQGVMTCEMATFGLPVITSDIKVCHEIFNGFNNVELINNHETDKNLKVILEKLIKQEPFMRNKKYFACNTTQLEVQLYYKLIGD